MGIRRKSIVLFCVICIVFLNLTGCGKKETPKPIAGKYVSVDGNSYIVLENYRDGKSGKFDGTIGHCDIQCTNVDLSYFSEFSIGNTAREYIRAIKRSGGSPEGYEETKKKFESNIDVNKQFIENKDEFEYFYSEYDKGYGLSCEIKGSGFDGTYESYVMMEYDSKEKIIICNEIKYILEE